MSPAPRMTTDEYLRTSETVLPQELVYGLVRDAAAPTPGHQATLLAMGLALVEHVNERDLGTVWISPIDVVLSREAGLVAQPDLIFVSAGRGDMVTDRVWGAPDMVLEVLSPHPRIGRLEERIGWFARYGVRECWLIHQEARRLEILTFGDWAVAGSATFDAVTPIRSTLLPDFDRTLDSILHWRVF